jgi:RNA polymerase sigma factor (sigma-70 family)
MSSPEVQHFLDTLRTGDAHAVEELLRHIDPFLRRVIRQRLIDGRLRRVVDTTDVFHSVVKDFLARPRPESAGGTSDRTPSPSSGALDAYLAAAVRHKIQTRSRKEKRNAGSLQPEWDPASPGPSPSRVIQERDFNAAIHARLSEDKQRLYDLKSHGLTWDEIAERVGGQADALRMRLTRAIAAILRELDGAGVGHDP